MNLNFHKKILLLVALSWWLISPYTALAAETNGLPLDKMATTTQVQVGDSTPATPVATDAMVAPSQYIVVKTSQRTITAYTSEASQTDDSPCLTAIDFNLCQHNAEDSIAANFLDFGTKVRIPELFGDRVFVVRDRMNARFSNRIDVWMKNRSKAVTFGVQTAKIEVLADAN